MIKTPINKMYINTYHQINYSLPHSPQVQ